jgi:hypothetical protein
MYRKPLKPVAHGIADYVISAANIVVPTLLHLNPNAVKLFTTLSGSMLFLNGLTNTPVGIKKQLSFQDHKKADLVLLAGMSLLPLLGMIRKNRKTLYYTLGFLGLAAVNYVLTDYKAGRETK